MSRIFYKASVIIATYNREQKLVDTISCMLNCDYPHYEVVVVDQTREHTPEVGAALLAFQEDNRYRHVRLPIANLPLARNVGLDLARGDVVIYVDDDVIVDQDFIARHVRLFDDPAVGAVGGRIIEQGYEPEADENLSISIGRLGKYGPLQGHFYRNGPKCEIEWGMGCNMSFRRRALVQAGGFDERYEKVAYHEEIDAFIRVRREGYKAIFAPHARLVHLKELSGGCRSETDFKHQLYNKMRCQALIATCLHESRFAALSGIIKYGIQSALHTADKYTCQFGKSELDASVRNRLRDRIMLTISFVTFFRAFADGLWARYFERPNQLRQQIYLEDITAN